MIESREYIANQAKSPPIKLNVYFSCSGKKTKLTEIEAAIQRDYDEVKKEKDMAKEIYVYLKLEEQKIYYVVNGSYAGEIDLPLD